MIHKYSLLVLCIFMIISCSKDDNPAGSLQIVPSVKEKILCEDGFADGYPCNGYDLMARIDVITLAGTSSMQGNDIWGWTDAATGKEYALVGISNGTAFVDVSDPLNPFFLGRLNTSTISSKWRDIKVYGNYAFIVADSAGSHGMQVFDLTKLRDINDSFEVFTADAVYMDVDSCHNIVINESEGVAYLLGCRSANGGGPIFIDIQSPTSPAFIGEYTADGYSHDAQVITYNGPDTEHVGKEIFAGSHGDKVVILDVTDKTNPIQLATIDYPLLGYAHQGWFTEDHEFFILGDENDETEFGFNSRTIIFDFTNLDEPVLTSTYSGPTAATDHNGYINGNDFFLANYRAGLRVLDISNITDFENPMEETGYFDTYPSDNAVDPDNGAWSVYPFFTSGNIIISDISGGLFIVRKSGT